MSKLLPALRMLFVALVTLGLLASPAMAQDETDTDGGEGLLETVTDLADPLVRIKATPIADGLVRNGEWATMHVRLDNLGEPLVGELVITSRSALGESHRYSRQVELPAGARKEIRFLYKPGVGGPTRRIDFLAGRRTVGAEVPIRLVDANDVALAVIGEDAGGLNVVRDTWSGRVPARAAMASDNSFGGSNRAVDVGLIAVAHVPDRANGLDIFNAVVWLDADPSKLSPEQAAALRAYVAGGGHLLLTVTDRWRQLGQGQLADMLPVELSGVRDGNGAAALIGPGTTLAPQATALPRKVEGRFVEVLLADGPDAIWTVGTYGLGTVHVLTADPRTEPLKSGIPRELLWRQLLWLPRPTDDVAFFFQPGSGNVVNQIYDRDNVPRVRDIDERAARIHPRLLAAMDLTEPVMTGGTFSNHAFDSNDVYGGTSDNWWAVAVEFLKDIPGVAPIPMEYLLAFAAVYLLVIGPIDYFVLKLLRRQTLTWITFPVSIVVFSALALVGTSYVKGSQAVVTRYEIVDVLPGTDLWRGVSWYGVWSPRSTPLSMTSGEGDGVAEIREGAGYKTNVETVHGTAGSALTWDAQTWTLAYARTTWTAPGKGTFSAARLGDGSVEIKNDTNYGLTDVVVDFPNSRATLPSLGPGETRTVSPTGMQRPYPLDYPPEELELEQKRPWAVSNAAAYPEVRRGHLDPAEWDLVITGATTGPIEDSVLDGLTPNPRTLTVVRAPLLYRQGGS